jgi:hypothetical protein
MTTTWTISNLERRISDGYVTTAHCQVIAVEGDYTASISLNRSWPDGTINTPYEQLTQEIVLGWVWASGVNKTEIETSLANSIAMQKAPVIVTGVPWSQA